MFKLLLIMKRSCVYTVLHKNKSDVVYFQNVRIDVLHIFLDYVPSTWFVCNWNAQYLPFFVGTIMLFNTHESEAKYKIDVQLVQNNHVEICQAENWVQSELDGEVNAAVHKKKRGKRFSASRILRNTSIYGEDSVGLGHPSNQEQSRVQHDTLSPSSIETGCDLRMTVAVTSRLNEKGKRRKRSWNGYKHTKRSPTAETCGQIYPVEHPACKVWVVVKQVLVLLVTEFWYHLLRDRWINISKKQGHWILLGYVWESERICDRKITKSLKQDTPRWESKAIWNKDMEARRIIEMKIATSRKLNMQVAATTSADAVAELDSSP